MNYTPQVACLWLKTPGPTEKLAELCLRFSPQIAVRKNEAVFVEIGKMRLLYSPEEFVKIFQQLLKPWLKRIEVNAQLGLGRDLTDALVRARYGTENIDSVPLDALYDFTDPFNTDPIVRPYLQKMIFAFKELGIQNLSQFKKIPSSELVSRFGPIALLSRQRLDHNVTLTWPYWKPAEIIKEKTDFPYFEFYGELEPVLFELKKQLDQVFQRLWIREKRAQKMRLRVFFETNSRQPKPFREFNFEFLLPQAHTKGALAIIKERLTKDFTERPVTTPLQGIETVITETAAGISGQKNFFHRREEVAEAKYALLAQLTETHGEGSVYHAELVEDHRPERSWKRCNDIKNPPPKLNFPLRPTHLFKPEAAALTDSYLVQQGKRTKVVNRSPIERINGAWFEDPSNLSDSYNRDYFSLELEDGRKLFVFKNKDGNFFIQGAFA
jgi:protein ImuB